MDPRRARWDSVLRTAEEADRLRREGQFEAARETFGRAFQTTSELLADLPAGRTAPPDRPMVLQQMAYLSVERGRFDPVHLGQAIRYARRAMDAAGREWPQPLLNIGYAYLFAGLTDRAVGVIEYAMEMMPPLEQNARRGMLVDALVAHGERILRRGRLGAEGDARKFIVRAWEMDPNPATNRPPFVLQARLQEVFEKEANAAAKDNLELARIHARYGVPEKAAEYFATARNELGAGDEVRYVEARFVCEMNGSPEAMARGATVYQEMVGRGEMLPQSTAGLARTLRATGRGAEALELYGDAPELGPELREALLRIRIDRLVSGWPAGPVPAEARDAFAAEIAATEKLFLGGLDDVIRPELMCDFGFALADRSEAEALRRLIREFQSRYPTDLSVVILDALLQDLNRSPLSGVDAAE